MKVNVLTCLSLFSVHSACNWKWDEHFVFVRLGKSLKYNLQTKLLQTAYIKFLDLVAAW